jgi:hypothetical protein
MKKKIRNFVNNNTEFFNSTDILSARTLNKPLLQMFDTEEALSEYLSSTIKTLYHKKGNCIIPGYLEDFNNFKIGKINNKNYLRVPTGALLINEKPVFIKPNCEAFERALATAYGFNLHEYSNNINVNYELKNGGLEYTVTVTYLNFDNNFTEKITGKDIFEVLENFDKKFNKFKLQNVYIDNNSLELLLLIPERFDNQNFNLYYNEKYDDKFWLSDASNSGDVCLCNVVNGEITKKLLPLDLNEIEFDNLHINDDEDKYHLTLDESGLDIDVGSCNVNIKSNATSLDSTLNVTGGAAICGNATVGGTTCLKNTLDIDGDATVGGMLTTNGVTRLNDTLRVCRSTSLNDTLGVSGATTLNDTLSVCCKATLKDELDVTGATCLRDALNVDRATCLNSTLDVGSSTTIGGTLTAALATCLNSTLDVALATCLNSKLDVKCNTTIGGMLTANGTTTLKRALNVTGATCLCDELYVCCKATLNNMLTVDGATYLYDKLSVCCPTSLNDTLSVCCKATLKDKLDVTGATTLNDTLSVCCKATLKNELGVCCNTFIGGILYVDTIQSNTSGIINTCLKGNATTASCATCDGVGCVITTTYKRRQSCVKSPTKGTTSTIEFIDTISQDEQGVIAPTKKEITSATTDTKGIVQLSDATDSNSTSLAATANAVKKVQDNLTDAISTEVSNRDTAICACRGTCAAKSLSKTSSVGTSTNFAREDHVHPTTGLATVTCPDGGYYGIGANSSYDLFLRTPNKGLIPYDKDNTNGWGKIGTSDWPFVEMNAKTFCGNLVGTAKGKIPFDAAQQVVDAGTITRVIAQNVNKKNVGYVSRIALGLTNKDGQFSDGIISLGENDAGTIWEDFTLKKGTGGEIITSATVGGQSVKCATSATSATTATKACNAACVTTYPVKDNLYYSLAFLTTVATQTDGYYVRQSSGCSLTFNPSTGCTKICGSVKATSFAATSARDKKKDIVPTTHINAVEEINDIDIVDFTFKNDETNRRRVGFIADDTSPVFSGENQRGFDINNTVGMLLKAVQELSKEIKELKEKVK